VGVFSARPSQTIAPQLHRFSYERAGSKVTEVEGASHFVMLSRTDVVARRHPRGGHGLRGEPCLMSAISRGFHGTPPQTKSRRRAWRPAST